MMNFREICKTIFFCIVSVNLGISSSLEILGIVFAILFIFCLWRDCPERFVVGVDPKCRKWRVAVFGFYSGVVFTLFGLAAKTKPWQWRL